MNLKSLNYNHLYYFHAIAKEGSIAKASEILTVTQPTLSQQLKLLESSLGSELFARKGRSLVVNSRGEYIYEYTQQIFDLAEKMITGFAYNQQLLGQITYSVGLTPIVSRVFATYLLRPLLSESNIHLKVVETSFAEAIQKIYSSELDFIICESPLKKLLNDSVEVRPLSRPRYHFVHGKKFNRKDLEIPKDLRNVPYFKYSSSSSLQKEVDQFFFKNDTYPSVIGESDDINMITAATKLNDCFSILPDVAIREDVASGDLFSFAEFTSYDSEICAIYLKEKSNDDIKKIMDIISQNTIVK